MRCRRQSVSLMVRVLQVWLLHVQFVSSALPPLSGGGRHDPVSQQGQSGTSGRRTGPGSATGTINSHVDLSNSQGHTASNSRHRHQHSQHHQHHYNRHVPRGEGGLDTPGFQSRHERWAGAVFTYVHSLDCRDVFFTTWRECQALVAIPRHRMNVYVAGPSPYGRLRSLIPEEPLTGAGLHEGVVVVDPYPRANFGHLVVVFFVDSRVPRARCHKLGGVSLDDDDCLHLALRRRCRNALERLSRRRNYARRCEINFLPVVHLATRGASDPQQRHHHHGKRTVSGEGGGAGGASSAFQDDRTPSSSSSSSSGPDPGSQGPAPSSMREDLLMCRSQLAGFAPCPELRPDNGSGVAACDPLRDNTRRCSTTHEAGVRTGCRMFEVCDQAVLLSGGWHRHTARPHHLTNLGRMYAMLRHNGFKRRNIKIFFANGAPPLEVGRDAPHRVFPAGKQWVRSHVRRLCQTPHCVDSLLLYLNSPARSDGSALLWDTDGDGLASPGERYTAQELKADLAHCGARQVTLLVDQSFSGELVQELRHSPQHRNVLVMASGRAGEYSFLDEFTSFWAARNHTRSCSADIHAASRAAVRHSSPRMGEGEEGRIRSTIFGAPCDVKPPFSMRELRQNYFGCQNLPTAVWLREMLRASDTSLLRQPRDDDDEDDENDGYA